MSNERFFAHLGNDELGNPIYQEVLPIYPAYQTQQPASASDFPGYPSSTPTAVMPETRKISLFNLFEESLKRLGFTETTFTLLKLDSKPKHADQLENILNNCIERFTAINNRYVKSGKPLLTSALFASVERKTPVNIRGLKI